MNNQQKDVETTQTQPLNKKQYKFVEAWLDPNSDTFGNAYQSALKVGFSKKYAGIISSESQGNKWLEPAKKRLKNLQPEHIYQAMQSIALQGAADRDRLRALELMAKVQGMFIDRSISQVDVTFTNTVPRPATPKESSIIDQ